MPTPAQAERRAIVTGRDPEADPVERGVSRIGPPQPGTRYDPSYEEILASENPLRMLAALILGGERPPSVAAQDPYGIEAWQKGAGPMPVVAGPIKEVSNVAGPMSASALRGLKRAGSGKTAAATKAPKRSPLDPTIPNPELALTQVANRYPEIHAALGDEPGVVEHFGEGLRLIGRGLQPETAEDYRLAPSMRARLAHMFETGKTSPLQADWSAFTEPRILPAFGGDEELARLYANLWGAASQGTNVAQNTAEATSAWHYLLKHGRLPSAKEALMGGKHPTLAKIGLPTVKLPNMQRAVEGQILRGPKLKDMAAFHEGKQASPLDRHYIVGLGGDTETLEKQYALIRRLVEQNEGIRLVKDKVIDSPWGPITGDEYAYRRMVQALQRELMALDPSQPHNPIFGRTWEGIRDWKELPAYEGPGDIFERKGLLEPGAMVDLDPLEAALRGKGGPWQQKLLLSLFASVGPSLLFAPTTAEAADAPAPRAQPAPGRGPRDWLPTP